MKHTPLRYLARIQNSNVDKVIEDGETPVRLCNYVHVFRNDRITADMTFDQGSATELERKVFALNPGDVIITKDSEDPREIGVPALVVSSAEDIVCGYHLTILRPNEGVHGPYLYYGLCSKVAQEQFMLSARGITRFGLNQTGIGNCSIPLPSMERQIKIANMLEHNTRLIDDMIKEKTNFITLLREKRVAEISQAVTKGINSEQMMKPSGVKWIGDIPASWDLTKLGYLGRSANGINIGGDAFGTGYPFISYGDVYKNRQLPEHVKGLVESSKQDRRSYSVLEGDVLFTRTSETIDEIAFPSVCKKSMPDAVFAGFLIRFRPYPGVLFPGFSKYAFQNQAVRHFFSREMKIVTRASLSQGLLQSLPIPLPPIDVQTNIAAYLDQKETRFLDLVSETERSIVLLREKRAALITAAVTGQIDVRSAA